MRIIDLIDHRTIYVIEETQNCIWYRLIDVLVVLGLRWCLLDCAQISYPFKYSPQIDKPYLIALGIVILYLCKNVFIIIAEYFHGI